MLRSIKCDVIHKPPMV
ncbi:TPA: hypothetical protein ANIA_11418 [Aspergillus nidulans FGSC A4]|uniref:Uncharacterized protein n=1 Tax=Emericella nidulans (strain FGSC A4 / ATCC 38163 / CBS 112.46 / NRRL 194 / M139) TaxID=227321 RepID=C8V6J9_EMENI|nr:TPA: hypothetical protein ANIA_11418 [Aspergillus nidulans FGSC A4]